MTSTPQTPWSSRSMFAYPLVSNDAFASTSSPSPQIPYLPPSSEPPLAEDDRATFWLVFFESVAIGFIGTFFLMFLLITISCLYRGCYILFFGEEEERHRSSMSSSDDDEPVHVMTQTPPTMWNADKDIHLVIDPGDMPTCLAVKDKE